MSTPLPRFGFDHETPDAPRYFAVIVAGRPISPDGLPTQGTVKAAAATVAEWAAKTGLPLAYVHMGTTINWDDGDDDATSYEYADAVVGIVTAWTDGEAALDAAALDLGRYEQVPAGLWTDLETKHGIKLGRAEKNAEGNWVETSAPRLYLAPSGWTVASIRAEGEDAAIVTTCSEDTTVGVVLDRATHPRLWSGGALQLSATYA